MISVNRSIPDPIKTSTPSSLSEADDNPTTKIAQATTDPDLISQTKKAAADNFICVSERAWFGWGQKETRLYARDVTNSSITPELAVGYGENSDTNCQAVMNEFRSADPIVKEGKIQMNLEGLTSKANDVLSITGSVGSNSAIRLNLHGKGTVQTYSPNLTHSTFRY
jgi:hypothetical protein